MLARMQKSLKEKDQGFTLIELLVVIVIIGILAAIAIPLFLNQQKKAVDSSLKSDVKNAATTIESWRTDNPVAPVPALSLDAGATGASGTALDGFDASDGNVITVKPLADVGSYCVAAQNGASSNKTSWIVYDSTKGGLQKEWATTNPCFVAPPA